MTSKDFYSSRKFFIFEGATAGSIFALTGGAFLAGFLKYLGASDQFNGIIAAIPVLAGTIQIFSPMVFERLEKRKFLITLLCFIYRILLGLIVFIPLLVKDVSLRLGLFAGIYFLAYIASSFITPAAGNWIISLTPENVRGSYFGRRDSYSLAFLTIVSLIMGCVLDFFRNNKTDYKGFVIIFMFVIVLTLANVFFMSSVKEPPVRKSEKPVDIKSVLTIPLKDKKFRKIVILFILWNIGLEIGGPFFAVYVVTGLKLKYTYIMAMGIIQTLISVVAVRLWGKLADKKSWVFTTKVSIGLLALIHSAWFFMNTETSFILIPILYLMAGIAWAGINISIFNIQFKFSPEDGRTIYLGFNSALGGLVGFAFALIGSFIVGTLEGFKFNLFGLSISNIQIVFGISGILLGVCAGFIHNCIKSEMQDN